MILDYFEVITSWDNLWLAYKNAARGKRGHYPAAQFEYKLAYQLLDLQADLPSYRYHHGPYHDFYIHDPKSRKISAAPFRDRVVHHALCNIMEPVFEKRFIPHSYANRVGKGTHRAIDYLQHLARRYPYVLRADVVKHFPAIDHQILKAEIARHMPDERTLWLVDTILASGASVLKDEYQMVWFPGDDLFAFYRPRGLPIGNLTSQFWSNVYLNPFDWFITRELGCRAYLRYVDDFALFSHDKHQLWEWKQSIINRLATLRLTIHDKEAQVIPVTHGIPWLGFVVYPTHRRVKARNAVNFTRRFRRNLDAYAAGQITFAELDASVQGWINHVRYGDTWGLRTHIFDQHPIRHPPKYPP